jgi:ABC-type multidrug transport system fused ATPase/permease subunit
MYDKHASDKQNFVDFWQSVVLKNIPEAKFAFKNESKLMRFLSHIVSLYSPGFMSHITTALGNTIYFPTKDFLESNYTGCLKIVAHEFVHLYERKRDKPVVFELRYLFPQVLVLFSLLSFLSFISLWFMIFIVFLVALVPGIPAPFRAQYELAGYTMNLYYSYRGQPLNKIISQEASEIAGIFTGSWYYWMARDRQLIASMLVDRYERFPDSHPAFIEVAQWLKT